MPRLDVSKKFYAGFRQKAFSRIIRLFGGIPYHDVFSTEIRGKNPCPIMPQTAAVHPDGADADSPARMKLGILIYTVITKMTPPKMST